MIRQTDIPTATPGDVITAPMFNQLVKGANTGRSVSGDDTVETRSIGGNLSFTDPRIPPTIERGVPVRIIPGTGIGGGLYEGRMYLQVILTVPETGGATENIAPVPDVQTCYVLNLDEFNHNSNLITEEVTKIGHILGVFRGLPLVWVNAGPTAFANVRVKITSSAAGGGKYNGRLFTMRSTDVPAAGDLAESELGILPGADDCLILNMQEYGQGATHDLMDAANTNTFYFNGTLCSVNSDGKKVVAINGLFIGC